MFETIRAFFASISHYRILTYIPLGMVLHICISAIISVVLLKKGMSFKKVCIIVFFIGLTKEIFDSFVLNNTMTKHVLDMFYDMSFLLVLYLIRKMKKKSI